MPTSQPPQGPPPGSPDPSAPYGRPAQGPYAGPPMPPPQGYGFQQPYQPVQYQQPPQPGPPQASYTEWWWDGRKWRPPVPRMSRGQALAQLPGALLKLSFLLIFMVIIVVFLWSLL